jgi:TM2 domain-containing membrane protein YozV
MPSGLPARRDDHPGFDAYKIGDNRRMAFILWLIAVILVVAGIVQAVRGQLLWGIVLIVLGLLIGPGGVSIFDV